MKRFEERVTVNAPAEKVFAYVSDFERHGEWASHGLQVTKQADGPAAVGTKYSTVAKQFGTQREESTVTELEPGRMFGWNSSGVLGVVHHWFEVGPGEGGQTVLSKGGEFVQPKLIAKLTGFRINKLFPQGLRDDLQKIKAKLESSS